MATAVGFDAFRAAGLVFLAMAEFRYLEPFPLAKGETQLAAVLEDPEGNDFFQQLA